MVVGADAIGGPPHGDFTDEGGCQRSACRDPSGLSVVVAGVVSDVSGDVGDQSESLGQVVTPLRLSPKGAGYPR